MGENFRRSVIAFHLPIFFWRNLKCLIVEKYKLIDLSFEIQLIESNEIVALKILLTCHLFIQLSLIQNY